MAIVDGGDGNDSLRGRDDQADVISGFGGNDILNALRRIPGDVGDVVSGGDGIDTLMVQCFNEFQPISIFPDLGNATQFFVRSTSGKFFVDAFGIERLFIVGGSADDFIATGIAGGFVTGGNGDDHWLADLSGLITAFTFNTGGDGHGAGSGGLSAKAMVVNNIEKITLTTGSGNDNIAAGALADTIATGAGNDVVNAGTRQPGDAGDVIDMGAGIDTLIVRAQSETEPIRLFPGLGLATQFFVTSTSGNHAVTAFNVERVNVLGGSGNDFISTGTAGGVINGGGGIDHWLADFSASALNITYKLGLTRDLSYLRLASPLSVEQLTFLTGSGNDLV